jgi:hypothetical protein
MGFKAEVDKVLPGAHKDGLLALGNDSSRVSCKRSRQLVGSVYLDAAVKGGRWDYGIGVRRQQGKEEVLWVEVHSAATSDVKKMVKKLKWLKNWLGTKAPELRRLTAENGYLWIASGGVHIRKGSPQDKRLRKEGLEFPREHLRIE